MKCELGETIMTKFAALRPKTYPYLKDTDNSNKKAKGTKKICNKTKTALSSNDDKRLQTIDRITTCPYGYKQRGNMRNKIVKIQKMINFDDYTN